MVQRYQPSATKELIHSPIPFIPAPNPVVLARFNTEECLSLRERKTEMRVYSHYQKGKAIERSFFYREGIARRTDYPECRSQKKRDKRKMAVYHYATTETVKKGISFVREWQGKDAFDRHALVGELAIGNGNLIWSAYREEEAINCALAMGGNTVLAVEGEKCVDYANELGYAAITWQNYDAASITRTARNFKEWGLSLLYFPDWDQAGIKKYFQVKALFAGEGVACGMLDPIAGFKPRIGEIRRKDDIVDLAERLRRKLMGQDYEDQYEELDDADSGDTEDVVRFAAEVQAAIREGYAAWEQQELEKTYQKSPESVPHSERQKTGNHPEVKYEPPKPFNIGDAIAEKYGHHIIWDATNKEWYQYQDSGEREGTWKEVRFEFIRQYVIDEITAWGQTPSMPFANNAMEFLKQKVLVEEFEFNRDLIPFANGVFNRKTEEFKPHSPQNRVTWKLPYSYNPSVVSSDRSILIQQCQVIWDWLVEATGEESIAHVLVAYLAAVVRGMTHLQKYLECIGPAGSGKGTFLRLAQAIMGTRNTTETHLSKLETRTFAVDPVVDAPLVLITDAERWVGDCPIFKALTGQDAMSCERKMKQEKVGQGKTAIGMVILAGESIPQSSDSGGLNRRRLTVPFRSTVDPRRRRDLITINRDSVSGEFAPYLSAFFNLILSYSKEEIRELVLETQYNVPVLARHKVETMLETSSLLPFLNECCVYEAGERGYIGRNTIESESYPEKLYPAYVAFCNGSGYKPYSSNLFSSQVEQFMNNQLHLPVEKKRDSKGAYITNLRLRKEGENAPRSVDELAYDRITTTTTRHSSPEENDGKGTGQDVAIANAVRGTTQCSPVRSPEPALGAGSVDYAVSSSFLKESENKIGQAVVQNNSESETRNQKGTAQTAQHHTSDRECSLEDSLPHPSSIAAPSGGSTGSSIPGDAMPKSIELTTPYGVPIGYTGGSSVESPTLQEEDMPLAPSPFAPTLSRDGKVLRVGDRVVIPASAEWIKKGTNKFPAGYQPFGYWTKGVDTFGLDRLPAGDSLTGTLTTFFSKVFVVTEEWDYGREVTVQVEKGATGIAEPLRAMKFRFKKGDLHKYEER